LTPVELPRDWSNIRREWPGLSTYQRFEAAVAFLLTAVIAVVIAIALVRLVVTVAETLLIEALNPLDHHVFQFVFGEILTLLIALEFNHTLQYVIAREKGIVQARVVILIALLALARKVIVTDLTSLSAAWLAAFAGLVAALGITYFAVTRARPRSGAARGRPTGAAP
jgi:uncharacterized membrane protein (DUF373 family)